MQIRITIKDSLVTNFFIVLRASAGCGRLSPDSLNKAGF